MLQDKLIISCKTKSEYMRMLDIFHDGTQNTSRNNWDGYWSTERNISINVINKKINGYSISEFYKENYKQGDHYYDDYILIDSAEIKNKDNKVNKKTIMKSLTPMLKTMLDKKGRTLYKAGFLNGELELTEEGKNALNTIVFEANKDELVKLAEEKLSEEKE